MELAVKNMVCGRCIKVVKNVLDELSIAYKNVELGKIHLTNELTAEQSDDLKKKLTAEGFDVIGDQKVMLVERIKNLIIDLVYSKDIEGWNKKLSSYISDQLHKDYSSLSQYFSMLENTTIEQYFILQKLERVKEMLVYNQFSLSEIASKMGYSSVAHLSNQFKKLTGFTPTEFRKLKEHKKQFIDKI